MELSEETLKGYRLMDRAHKVFDLLKECNEFLYTVQAPATSALFLREKVSNLIKEIDGDK